MKLNTFLRKVPLLFGAVLLITVFLFASCQESKQDDDDKSKENKKEKAQGEDKKGDGGKPKEGASVAPTKDPTLSFALGDTSDLAGGGKYAVEYLNGGVSEDKTFYKARVPDGTKYFTLTATATSSKGTVTYELWSVGTDGTQEKSTADKGIVDNNGKVVIKSTKDGFYYLKAKIAAKGDYTEGEKNALLVVGEVPVPTGALVVSEVSNGDKSGADTFGTAPELNADKTTLTVTADDGKKLTLTGGFDMTKFPAEAPVPEGFIELKAKHEGADELFSAFTYAGGDNKTVFTGGTGTAATANNVVQAKLTKVAPYAAVAAFVDTATSIEE